MSVAMIAYVLIDKAVAHSFLWSLKTGFKLFRLDDFIIKFIDSSYQYY